MIGFPGGLGDLDPREAAASSPTGGCTGSVSHDCNLRWWMGWTMARTKQALADCEAVEIELDGRGPGR
jgi:hypothetical protein